MTVKTRLSDTSIAIRGRSRTYCTAQTVIADSGEVRQAHGRASRNLREDVAIQGARA